MIALLGLACGRRVDLCITKVHDHEVTKPISLGFVLTRDVKVRLLEGRVRKPIADRRREPDEWNLWSLAKLFDEQPQGTRASALTNFP